MTRHCQTRLRNSVVGAEDCQKLTILPLKNDTFRGPSSQLVTELPLKLRSDIRYIIKTQSGLIKLTDCIFYTKEGEFLSKVWSTFVVHYDGFPRLGGALMAKAEPPMQHLLLTK